MNRFVICVLVFGGACQTAGHAEPVQFEANFSTEYSNTVSRDVEYTYWFNGTNVRNDVTVKVRSGVDETVTVDDPVQFEVRWEEQLRMDSVSWVIPVLANSSDRTLGVYNESTRTLCNVVSTVGTVRVTVSSLSVQPVGFTLFVYANESNVITTLDRTKRYDFDLTLFSPVYYMIKISDENVTRLSGYAMLEISSDDDVCVSVGLQGVKCPVLDKENDVGLDRHLTMTRNASVTIEMSDLIEGRFLVFVLHQNDTKCTCDDCSSDNILPMEATLKKRTKRLSFVVRPKISNEQYILASVVSAGFLLSVLLVFPVVYCACQTIRRRRGREVTGVELGGSEDVALISERSVDSEGLEVREAFVFGFLVKRPKCCERGHVPIEVRKRIGNRYFGTLVVNAIFYILPAVQLIWIYQRVFEFSGDEDVCYFNFRCLHPLVGITAFNHLFSNIGYVVLGVLFCIVVKCDNVGSRTSGIFQAMGIALVIQGVMSALYHTCPTQLSFQFDTCFMYVTAMLCWVHVYQAHNPEAAGSAILSYTVVAVAVSLGVAAVLFRIFYFWILIGITHAILCLVVSLHLDSLSGKYKWGVVWPCKIGLENVKLSFLEPFYPDSFSLRKIALVFLNFINWGAAVVGLWVFIQAKDFASYMLLLFILNLFLFSATYFYIKFRQGKVSKVTAGYLFALVPIWSVALYFYYQTNSSWTLSPAESRTWNKDCSLFNFFDEHDIWHFVSAFGMFLNFMLFFTMDDGDGTQCVDIRVE